MPYSMHSRRPLADMRCQQSATVAPYLLDRGLLVGLQCSLMPSKVWGAHMSSHLHMRHLTLTPAARRDPLGMHPDGSRERTLCYSIIPPEALVASML